MAPPDPVPVEKDSDEQTTLIDLLPGSTAPALIRLAFGARTHLGKVRTNNEDQYLIARLLKSLEILNTSLPPEQRVQLPDQEAYVLLVADGMGGHAEGELASAFAVNESVKFVMETAKWFFRLDDPDENVRLRLLRENLDRLDRQLIEEGIRNPKLAGKGTTLTAMSIIGAEAFIVHVGDCRAYLLRGTRLEQLTRDHTRAQELLDRGLIQPEDVRTHRLRHILTNSLGGKRGVEGEIVKLRLLDGDRLLLCTDGLTEQVRDERITEILCRSAKPEEACHDLVEEALNLGGRDNITVVLAACSIQELGQ